MNWLLDTCVLSEYTKRHPDKRVVNWLNEQAEGNLFTSAICLAELEKGIHKLAQQTTSQQTRARELAAWLAQLRHEFATRVLPIDDAVLLTWSRLTAEAELAGQPISPLDGLIMATAHSRGMTLVTRNTADFARYQSVFSPWD